MELSQEVGEMLNTVKIDAKELTSKVHKMETPLAELQQDVLRLCAIGCNLVEMQSIPQGWRALRQVFWL